MSGYFLAKNAFPSSSCSVTLLLLLQYEGLKVRLSQNVQPPVDILPSLFGQENPASTDSFCTLNGKRLLIHVPKS